MIPKWGQRWTVRFRDIPGRVDPAAAIGGDAVLSLSSCRVVDVRLFRPVLYDEVRDFLVISCYDAPVLDGKLLVGTGADGVLKLLGK